MPIPIINPANDLPVLKTMIAHLQQEADRQGNNDLEEVVGHLIKAYGLLELVVAEQGEPS